MAEFRGNLYVFVDARADGVATPSENESGDIFGFRATGEMLWYQIGWAVSKNLRGTYCSRTSTTKLRAFGTFAVAMDFVREKHKTRPKERFHLVYELDGRKSVVTSLEQIVRMDENGTQALPLSLAGGEKQSILVLDALTKRVGKIVAANALELLRILEQEGEAAARARFSGATYDRLSRVLHEAALVAEDTSPN